MDVPELIRQAVVNENHNFRKVILNVAVGLKDCGFFDKSDWKATLEQCFQQTNTEMQFESNELFDVHSSYEDAFANILVETTSSAADSTQIGKRTKRSSTLLYDDDSFRDKREQFKKSSNLRHDDDKVVNILADLKEANWRQILPAINTERSAVKYETVFEIAKQLREANTSSELNTSSNLLTAPHRASKPDQDNVTTCKPIRKRRFAFCLPSPKRKAISSPVSVALPVPVPVNEFLTNVSEREKSFVTETSDDTLTVDRIPLTNVTIKRIRTSRNRTQPVVAYSHEYAASANIIDRQTTSSYFRRTFVLFTTINASQYQDILGRYNIFVADVNDNYDYVIAERICRSPKFLTAVVSGKPIVSIEWIHALIEKNVWLDPLTHLLKDDSGEREYNFDLAHTQHMARNKRLFENYSILVTPHIDVDLKSVVFSGGGRFLQTNVTATTGDEILCVSDETDKQMWPKLQRKYPTLKRIISLDGFLKMIFQYTHDINATDIFYQI